MNVDVLMNNCLCRREIGDRMTTTFSLSIEGDRRDRHRERERYFVFIFHLVFRALSVWRLMSSYIDCTCVFNMHAHTRSYRS